MLIVGDRVEVLEDVTGDRLFRHIEKGDTGVVKDVFYNMATERYGVSVHMDWFDQYEIEEQVYNDPEFDMDNKTYDFYNIEVRLLEGCKEGSAESDE